MRPGVRIIIVHVVCATRARWSRCSFVDQSSEHCALLSIRCRRRFSTTCSTRNFSPQVHKKFERLGRWKHLLSMPILPFLFASREASRFFGEALPLVPWRDDDLEERLRSFTCQTAQRGQCRPTSVTLRSRYWWHFLSPCVCHSTNDEKEKNLQISATNKIS